MINNILYSDNPFKKILLSMCILLAFIGSMVSVAVVFTEKSTLTLITLKYTFYILVVVFGFWLAATIRLLRQIKLTRKVFLDLLPGFAFALILTIGVGLSTDVKFRVLADEANLVSVSKSMLYDRSVRNTTQGKHYYQNFHPTHSVLGKRPFLYPFGIHLLHLFSGYRVYNAFILNLMLLFGLLLLAFQVFKRHYGLCAGVVVALLLVAQPILPACATSAGFDLLACFLFVASMIALWKALQNPDQTVWMHFAIAQFILLAHVRYESMIFFIISFSMLVILKKFTLQHLKERPIGYALIPMLLSPLVWQRLAKGSQFEEPSDTAVFSVLNIFNHSLKFLKTTINFEFFLPYAGIVNVLGCLGIIYLTIRVIRKSVKTSDFHLSIILAVNLLVVWVLFTSYYSGDPERPFNARFFLIPCVALSFSAAYFIIRVTQLLKIHATNLVVFSVIIFIMYYPIAIEDRFFNTQQSLRQYSVMEEFIKKYADQNILMISDRPIYSAIHNVGSMSFVEARKTERKILRELDRKLYKDIFVVQQIRYKTSQPDKSQKFSDDFPLIPLEALQTSSSEYHQISKVKKLNHFDVLTAQ